MMARMWDDHIVRYRNIKSLYGTPKTNNNYTKSFLKINYFLTSSMIARKCNFFKTPLTKQEIL